MLTSNLKTYYALTILFLVNVIFAKPINSPPPPFSTTQLISPPHQSLGQQNPIQLNWTSPSNTVDIEIIECSTNTTVDYTSVGLDDYVLDSGPIVINAVNDDMSGITYNRLTNTLFIVDNMTPTVYETDLNGNFLRSIFLSGFDDTEGITHIGGTRYAVTEERIGRITFFDIMDTTTIVMYNEADYVQLDGPWNNNQGLEGVSYNPLTGEIHTVKEKTPKGYYSFPIPTNYPSLLSSNPVVCDMTLDPFGFGDIAGIQHLAQVEGLAELHVEDNVMLLSHESRAVVEVDKSCNEVSRLSLNTGGANGTLSNSLPQPEGITMDDNGTLYIMSEPNQLFIFKNPNLDLNPTDEQAVVHTATVSGSSYTVPANILSPETEYCWRINDGNGWTDYWSFTTAPIVFIYPTVTIISPANNSHYDQQGTITLSAHAYDVGGQIVNVEFFVDSISVGLGQQVGNSDFYEINYTLEHGNHIITALATDNDGQETTSDPISITVDNNQCPTVEITSPYDGLIWWKWIELTILADAIDPDGTITQVEFFVNGVSVGIDETFPYSTSYYFGQDDIYEVIAVATDNMGCVVSSEEIWIDTHPNYAAPIVNITSPLNGTILTAFQSLPITANANDPDGFVTSVDFFVNGIYVGTDTEAPYSIMYDFDEEGTYSIVGIATDNTGTTGISTSVVVTVVVGNSAPEITMTSPRNDVIYSTFDLIELSAEAGDPEGDIQRVKFLVNGLYHQSDDEFPYRVLWQAPSPGTYTIAAITTDEYGVNSPVSEVTIVVEYSLDNCPVAGLPCNDNDATTSNTFTDGNCGCFPLVSDNILAEYQIKRANYDAEESGTNGKIFLNSSDLEMAYDRNATGNQTIGLHFRGIDIPQNTVIDSAFIVFTVDETNNNSGTLQIFAEANPCSSPFTESPYNISSRPKTNASVTWNPDIWQAIGASEHTPDLAIIIQEIIDKDDWTGLGHLNFIIEGTGKRTAKSFEGAEKLAPKLRIYY